jgi:hypothetical protein
MRFNVYGKVLLEVIRDGDRRTVYALGDGMRTPRNDIVVPSEVGEGEISVYLDDLFHELADQDPWSKTEPVRRLLGSSGIPALPGEMPFRGWNRLPKLALLSIKWYLEKGRPFWHWALFVREGQRACVVDSKASLPHHVRATV